MPKECTNSAWTALNMKSFEVTIPSLELDCQGKLGGDLFRVLEKYSPHCFSYQQMFLLCNE